MTKTMLHSKNVALVLLLVSTLVAFSCRKAQVATKPPAPPPVTTPTPPTPTPTITLRAEPATIDRGGSVTLQWEARNAATVSITPGLGDVPVSGNRSVSPTSSVSYQATATGPGGTATDVARITVNIPPAPTPDKPKPTVTGTTIDAPSLKDVLFEYDQADIRADMVAILQGNANWMKANPNARVTIQGHCDERGSEEYNLGLGDRRANAVKEYLLSQGIPASRLNTVSYGEDMPSCREQSEACFARNRRAHLLAESR